MSALLAGFIMLFLNSLGMAYEGKVSAAASWQGVHDVRCPQIILFGAIFFVMGALAYNAITGQPNMPVKGKKE